LKTGRHVTLWVDPDPGPESTFEGHEDLVGKADVRVLGVKAYLTGASKPGKRVQLDVLCGGRCQVQPMDGRRHALWFDTPEVLRTNVFLQRVDGTFSDESSEVMEQSEMKWGGEHGTDTVRAPLSSIYSSWTVRVPNPQVELDGVTKVVLEFRVAYRAFTHPRTTPAAD
jgi:hypothetical protein